MAVDSKAKRASALGFGDDDAFPFRDPSAAAFDQADRQHMLGCYRGILAGQIDRVGKLVCLTVQYAGRQALTAVYGGVKRLTVGMRSSCE